MGGWLVGWLVGRLVGWLVGWVGGLGSVGLGWVCLGIRRDDLEGFSSPGLGCLGGGFWLLTGSVRALSGAWNGIVLPFRLGSGRAGEDIWLTWGGI